MISIAVETVFALGALFLGWVALTNGSLLFALFWGVAGFMGLGAVARNLRKKLNHIRSGGDWWSGNSESRR